MEIFLRLNAKKSVSIKDYSVKLGMVALCFCVPVLSACGGGGGGSEQPSVAQEVVNPYIEGIGDLEPGVYVLHTGNAQTGVPDEGSRIDVVVISDSGRTVRNLLNFDQPLRFGAAKFTSNTDFIWSEKLVSWRNLRITDEPTDTPGTVFDPQTYLLSYQKNPELALLAVKMSQQTEPGVTLEELSGTYTGAHHRLADGRRAAFTIDSNGQVTGADDKGCVFNGQVTNLVSNYRIFDIDVQAANCQGDTIPATERNGSFSGVGILNAAGGADDLLLYTYGNDFAYTFTSAN